MRPSESAAMLLDMAHASNANAKNAAVNEMPGDLIDTLNFNIQALMGMNTGLRAIYMKLEQIEARIKR